MEKLERKEFAASKRERLLDVNLYESAFDSVIRTNSAVSKGLSQPAEVLASIPVLNFMEATRQLAWKSLDHLMNCYSAGHRVDELRALYPSALSYWEEYARYSLAFKNSEEGKHGTVGHISLADTTYVCGLQLVCFGILLGWPNLLHRIPALIDYRNRRDGLLDRLLACFDIDRGSPPDDCIRHLPYIKTLKIFSASAVDRPALMREYLEDWYAASRREEYFDSHKRGSSFSGYWSLESGAITIALNIDDSSYRDADFYPRDLVDFARQSQRDYAPEGAPPLAANELRAKAGDPCPKAGLWQSLGIPTKAKQYEMEQPMENLGSAYGLTVWRLTEDR